MTNNNTSATGGYVVPIVDPTLPVPLEDNALDDFLQQMVSGVTGLPGTNVIPRWQPEPPSILVGNWCAVGEVANDPDPYAYLLHQTTTAYPNGVDILMQWENGIDCLCSFYGPLAGTNAKLFTNGVQEPQNREQLIINGYGLKNVTGPRIVPELVKMRWLRRVDVHFTLMRMVARYYPIENIVSATATIETESGLTEPVNVQE